MYRKICVAVDGSESSFDAVKTAANLALKVSAELVVYHVIRNMKVPDELKRFVKNNSLERMRHEALEGAGKEIVAHAIGVAQEQGVAEPQTDILMGDPASAVAKAASQQDCDLIVVGTRGLGQVEGMLIGSMSRKLTSISKISVLVVK
ncbi:MAG: universal stress protein [Motiliproteus sp.]